MRIPLVLAAVAAVAVALPGQPRAFGNTGAPATFTWTVSPV